MAKNSDTGKPGSAGDIANCLNFVLVLAIIGVLVIKA
jgi:hypothetical protein